MFGLFRRRLRDDKTLKNRLPFTYLKVGLIFLFTYLILTEIFLVPLKVESRAMMPTVNRGDRVIFSPIAYRRTRSMPPSPSAKSTPQRGDVVVITPPYFSKSMTGFSVLNPLVRFFTFQKVVMSNFRRNRLESEYQVKRIVGLPGDTIKMVDFNLFVKLKGENYFSSEFELTKTEYDLFYDPLPSDWDSQFLLAGNYPEKELREGEYFVLGDRRLYSNDSHYWGVLSYKDILGKVLFRYAPFTRFGSL